jgi:Histidine kinase-, DNA gyrase B-, and HSP90-like ATPase
MNDERPATSEGNSTGSPAPAVPVAGFVSAAQRDVAQVDVRISLGIIDRFSEGLYSSPTKTFEELVSNSWDAEAGRVWLYLSADLSRADASVLVFDDGASMDVEGFRDLWMVGESPKRRSSEKDAGRRPIGKFGIGKLATYVLAHELTYVVLKNGEYRAITMDFGRVTGKMNDPRDLRLNVAILTESEARVTLETALSSCAAVKEPQVIDVLFGKKRPKSWTVAILTNLKETARTIELGRLRWVLRTALPLNPGFNLRYNDELLKPSKASGAVAWHYTIGESEQAELAPSEQTGIAKSILVDGDKTPAYELPRVGLVWGEATLYKEPLQRGKSEELGRSHGIFVRVRRRLVNLDDADFNVGPELRHGTLTRFHMVVNADGLDDLIASPRESLKESPELRELKKYVLAVFNRARTKAQTTDSEDILPLLTKQGRIAEPPSSLSQSPLRRMIRRALDGDDLVSAALGIDQVGLDAYSSIDATSPLVEFLLLEPLGAAAGLVAYDPGRRAVVVNRDHPFVNNFADAKGADEPLRLMGLVELMTRGYMLDEGIEPDQIARVQENRDLFMRDLVRRFPRSPEVVAQHLIDSANDEDALEDTVADALRLLGFEVHKIGGQGETDGIATANLGRRGGARESYAFTYDAKSSGKDAEAAIKRIRASTLQTSILRVHRERSNELDVAPDFTLVVAPGFQGDGVPGSLVGAISTNDTVTPITVADLAALVRAFPVKWISPHTLRPMFDLHTPDAVRDFVLTVTSRDRPLPVPMALVLKEIVEFSSRRSPITVEGLYAAIAAKTNGAVDLPMEDLRAAIRAFRFLAPRTFFFDGYSIALNSPPREFRAEVMGALENYGPAADVIRADMNAEDLQLAPGIPAPPADVKK